VPTDTVADVIVPCQWMSRIVQPMAMLTPVAYPAPQELGWYDPLRKETNLNAPAIKKWLSVGAQPSETVGRLLKKAMVME